MNDERVRPMPLAQKVANALALVALAIAAALWPAGALPIAGLLVPLALALLGATQRARAGVAMRGFAIAANGLGVLACASLSLAAGLGLARGMLEAAGAIRALALFGLLLALYVLNLRVLVGPPIDPPPMS